MDLEECARRLKEDGYEILDNPGVMLVVRREVELTLYPHGRILMHPVRDRESAELYATKLYNAVGM